jgi:hypothetical protein
MLALTDNSLQDLSAGSFFTQSVLWLAYLKAQTYLQGRRPLRQTGMERLRRLREC